MITNDGKIHVKRYMAGFVPSIAQSLAIGIGNKEEVATDTKMQFEVIRTDILLTSFDFVNNRIIYKAEIPNSFSGIIYEVGVYSELSERVGSNFDSRLLVTFDSATEDWVDTTTGLPPAYASGNSRIGINSLRHTPAASASETDSMSQLSLNLSAYSGSDTLVFAYSVANANTASIKFRFMTNASNYYEFTLGTQTAGYKVTEVAKSTAVATGAPSWADITEIRVITTSGSGGASQVDFDGIRIEDTDTINPGNVLVSRKMLATPITKEEGKTQEIEFALGVTV